MKTADFDYYLPPELIAQHPAQRRDESRLLVLRKAGGIAHSHFYQLPQYLKPGDLLVLNDTKVRPARLFGEREDTGSSVEVVLLHPVVGDRWETLVKPGKKAKPGTQLSFGGGLLKGEVLSTSESGGRTIQFHYDGSWEELLGKLGEVPLPPYIHEKLDDPERYQTVYAKEEGSAAAPTAGLHFTPELLEKLQQQGVELTYLTLHVGLGTFRPVHWKRWRNTKCTQNTFLFPKTVSAIRACRERREGGGSCTATVRALESVQRRRESVPQGGQIFFIHLMFKTVDGYYNFHFPAPPSDAGELPCTARASCCLQEAVERIPFLQLAMPC